MARLPSRRIRRAARRSLRVRTVAGGRRLALIGALLTAALAALAAAPWLLAPLDWNRQRVEASLGALLGARARVGAVTYVFPASLEARDVALSIGPAVVATLPRVLATPSVWTLAGRPLRFAELALEAPRFSRAAAGALAELLSQPADRLPPRVSVTGGELRLLQPGASGWPARAAQSAPTEAPELEEHRVSELAASLVSTPAGKREFQASFRALEAEWSASGRLVAALGGALQLECECRTEGPFELPLPGRRVRVDAAARLALSGRLQDRKLVEYYGQLRVPKARVGRAGSRWSGTTPELGLAVENGRVRLDETTFDFGGTRVRLRGALESSGRGELSVSSDRFGLDFPRPPGAGEAALSASVVVAGGWPAPRLKASLRLLQGTLREAVRSLEVQLEGDFDLLDLRLGRAKIGGLINACPITLSGAVTIPPWDPGNPLVSATVEAPALDARLAPLLGAAGAILAGGNELGFRGQARGPILSFQATGELTAHRGTLLGLNKAAARVRFKQAAKDALPILEVDSLTGELDGAKWSATAPFAVSFSGRPILTSPVVLRSAVSTTVRSCPAGTPFAGEGR